MDRATIAICRIDVALNGLLTASLTDKEIEEMEAKVVGIIDKATHRRTPKFLKQREKERKTEESVDDIATNLVKSGPEQSALLPASQTDKHVAAVPSNKVKESIIDTDKKKRVRWDCNTCISKCDKEKGSDSICLLCYEYFEKTGKTNYLYQRVPKDVPKNCKECGHCKWLEEQQKYMCEVNYKVDGDDHVTHFFIRNNYLHKNRPSYCKL